MLEDRRGDLDFTKLLLAGVCVGGMSAERFDVDETKSGVSGCLLSGSRRCRPTRKGRWRRRTDRELIFFLCNGRFKFPLWSLHGI